MPEENRLTQSYDFSLGKAEILSHRLVDGSEPFRIDILPIIGSIELVEAIDKPFLEGHLFVLDSNDIRTLLPLTGLERLHLKFNTPGVPGVNAVAPDGDPFYIYKIENVGEDKKSNRALLYDIHFCSKEAYYESMRKVSKVVKGSPELGVEDIVRNKKYLNSNKKLYVEPSRTKTKMVIPNCSPVNAISLLSAKTQSKKYKNSGYLFFETPEGFHYRSIESLLASGGKERPTKWWYATSIKNIRNPRTGVVEMAEAIHQVEDWRLDYSVNILDNIDSGSYASKLIQFDPFYKTITKNDFNLFKEWDKHYTTQTTISGTSDDAYGDPKPLPKATFDGNKKYLSEEYDSVVYLKSSTSNTYGDEVEKDSHKDLTQQAMSQRGLLQNGLLSLIVPGNSLIHAGDVIDFEMPLYRPIGENLPRRLNPQWSGRYLVLSIKHTISTQDTGKYELTINAAKQAPKIGYISEGDSWEDGIRNKGTYSIYDIDNTIESRGSNKRVGPKMKHHSN